MLNSERQSYFVLRLVLLVAAGRESAREPQQKAVKQRISLDPVHPPKGSSQVLAGLGEPSGDSPVKISLCALRVLTRASAARLTSRLPWRQARTQVIVPQRLCRRTQSPSKQHDHGSSFSLSTSRPAQRANRFDALAWLIVKAPRFLQATSWAFADGKGISRQLSSAVVSSPVWPLLVKVPGVAGFTTITKPLRLLVSNVAE